MQHPLAHGAGEMADGGVDGDHQVEAVDDRQGVGEFVDLGSEVDQRRGPK